MEEQRKMKPLQKKDFGKTSKGELATVYTLENEAGMQISVSDFGATLTSYKAQRTSKHQHGNK